MMFIALIIVIILSAIFGAVGLAQLGLIGLLLAWGLAIAFDVYLRSPRK